MGRIVGKIFDKQNGQILEARVQVLSPQGTFVHPKNAILKVGTGMPFFYSDGEFRVDVPRGINQIVVERGTEYIPSKLSLSVPEQGILTVDIEMERWLHLTGKGWYPGNTHIHYDQNEKRPDERLRLDPRIEDLRFTAISILKRRNMNYASNKYPPGVLTEFCTAHHYVECGEENRHNNPEDSLDEGYGHIMLLRIKEVVEPISRGYLVDDVDPDYPPLCYACDDAHRQGGIVIWCHNGKGMEAPVSAALGKLDAFNLFDPYWQDPEYDIWYAMLNCGFKLPASTGSDWFICSGNRVYTYTGNTFQYEDWINGLKEGRTFITNGPALFLTVDGQMPGGTIHAKPRKRLTAIVSWKSHYAIQQVEVIWNGNVAAMQQFPQGSVEGKIEADIGALCNGWIAARIYSSTRDSFFQPIYAHTSPIYVITGLRGKEEKKAARQFACSIEQAIESVKRRNRFRNAKQRNEVVELFRRAQTVYKKLFMQK